MDSTSTSTTVPTLTPIIAKPVLNILPKIAKKKNGPLVVPTSVVNKTSSLSCGQETLSAETTIQQEQAQQQVVDIKPKKTKSKANKKATAATTQAAASTTKRGRKPKQADKAVKAKSTKKQDHYQQQTTTTELSNNPLKQAILKINEENYYLKLEVIKLVSDLKTLKYESGETDSVIASTATTTTANTPTPMTTNNDTITKNDETTINKDISSVPMGYNSTSNKTINNNTIYKINSNTTTASSSFNTNPSTPSMMTATGGSSPLTTATTPGAVSAVPQQGKKRAHDEDVNDLILALVDLNHSKAAAEAAAAADGATTNTNDDNIPLTSNNLNSLLTEQNPVPVSMSAPVGQAPGQAPPAFDGSYFLDLDKIEDPATEINANLSSSPSFLPINDENDVEVGEEHQDNDHDMDSIDFESLTPNSLLSLSKTNSTIDEIDLDGSHHNNNNNNNHHHHHHHHHFSPKLLDIPEIPSTTLYTSENDLTFNQGQGLGQGKGGFEFSFWKAANDNTGLLKKDVVFNTNSTIDELIMARHREREDELMKYNELNDMIDFEQINNTNDSTTTNNNSTKQYNNSVVFNDDWRLDGDDLLNF